MAIINIYPDDEWEIPSILIPNSADIDYGIVLPYNFPLEEDEKDLQLLYHKELINLLQKALV